MNKTNSTKSGLEIRLYILLVAVLFSFSLVALEAPGKIEQPAKQVTTQENICPYDQRTKMIEGRIKKNLERNKRFVDYSKKSREIRGSGFTFKTEN